MASPMSHPGADVGNTHFPASSHHDEKTVIPLGNDEKGNTASMSVLKQEAEAQHAHAGVTRIEGLCEWSLMAEVTTMLSTYTP